MKHEKTLPPDTDLEDLKKLAEKSGLSWQSVMTATTKEDRDKFFKNWQNLTKLENALTDKIQLRLLGKQ